MKADGAFFQMRKWYVDCVTADGTAFIGYASRIRLGPVDVPYQAYLFCPVEESPRSEFAFGGEELPALRDESLAWRSSRLGLRSSWTRAAGALTATLLDEEELGVQWRCHVPAGTSVVEGVSPIPISGAGYAEELVVKGDPRRLPIDSLLWGRFITPEESVAWIRWMGQKPLTLVVHNGAMDPRVTVDETGVFGEDGGYSLDIADRRVLRDSSLGRSVFPDHALLRRLIPRKLRNVRETKWLSPACIRRPGHPDLEGWALHERVLWP